MQMHNNIPQNSCKSSCVVLLFHGVSQNYGVTKSLANLISFVLPAYLVQFLISSMPKTERRNFRAKNTLVVSEATMVAAGQQLATCTSKHLGKHSRFLCYKRCDSQKSEVKKRCKKEKRHLKTTIQFILSNTDNKLNESVDYILDPQLGAVQLNRCYGYCTQKVVSSKVRLFVMCTLQKKTVQFAFVGIVFCDAYVLKEIYQCYFDR